MARANNPRDTVYVRTPGEQLAYAHASALAEDLQVGMNQSLSLSLSLSFSRTGEHVAPLKQDCCGLDDERAAIRSEDVK
jgi:hypothetical protein